MQDHDIYLRHASIHDGDWLGFTLARPNLAGLPGLPPRPHTRFRPWLLDPSAPNDPTQGDWGIWQWRLTLAICPLQTGLQNTPSDDTRTPTEIRADLLSFLDLSSLQLQDIDTTIYTAKITAYTEQSIQSITPAHPHPSWLATIELAETE